MANHGTNHSDPQEEMQIAGVRLEDKVGAAEISHHTLRGTIDAAALNTSAGPIKGGILAESTSSGRFDAEVAALKDGRQEVFLITRRRGEALETPTFRAADSGQQVLAVFTTNEAATLYLQVAGWRGDYDVTSAAPIALGAWLRDLHASGIDTIVVDPDRQDQLAGEPQQAIFLNDIADHSDFNLYREVIAAATQTANEEGAH